ncbi:Type I restriction-modification system methyltransferase subunit [Agrobacterium sp. DSM 25558]|uniref:HsdM family class I SAM-dependent methyltransferase n=1 Tax=Agrobacterium sp. DSM 25558 TaxID=1907665 RepID=UPI000972527C|nr:N-6 DNA methylase [Agrobacterium sp. DSM 25558]SCX28592.1 Type I restriction-modification system methyltransferase subunit [Agrobacterium sp. DSM 25558]
MNKGATQDEKAENLFARIEDVITRLGFGASAGLTRSWDQFKGTSNRHIVRQAFDTVGAYAVFGFGLPGAGYQQSFTPILYFCAAQDDAAAKDIHRLVWSQGVVPLLFVATPSGLQIRRGLAPPPEQAISLAWEKLTDSETLPVELTSLTAIALSSSVVWRDFSIDRSSRVDKALLEGIVALSQVVQTEQTELERSVIHAIIGRFLYLYVLLDRHIVDTSWIASLKAPGGDELLCPSIAASLDDPQRSHVVWPAKEVWSLFDAIDGVMNGAIFPVSESHRKAVTDGTLHMIHRVIRHGDRVSPAGRQLSFLDVSFSTLRTETISAIYELFLALESQDTKSDDGAFYTPPFLVDYVLDETDRIEPFTKESRVLDPAAGSGIFLVGAYRRILERTLPAGTWGGQQFRSSRKLLERNIFGIERNGQAANVCRFSLYLTLLDYISGANITALAKMARGTQVFPPLVNNIISQDVFAVQSEGPNSVGRFTHVVGNPPWGSFGDSASRTNAQRSQERQDKIAQSMVAAIEFHTTLNERHYPISNKRLSELFIWKIKRDLLAVNGVMGVLISTRSFVSRSASAFPNAVASHFALAGIANLSHFRYRLFAEARSPTIAVFARNIEPHPMDEVWIYSPLLSSQPIGEKGHLWSIIANASDVETHRLRDLVRDPDGWFTHLILRPLDRRYARHIKLWTEKTSKSLGGFLEAWGLRMSRGGSPAQTGLPEKLLLKANYKQALGLEGFGFEAYPHMQLERYQIAKQFKALFSGNVLLIPRSMNDAVFIEKPVGFSSTFNAIYFPERIAGVAEKKLLSAMANYLLSDVASYFYALIGKSWILDHARLEKHDLEAVPFPIDGLGDSALDTLLAGDQSMITNLVSARMGLDVSFAASVKEYVEFRSGYEDSQLPTASLQRPNVDKLDRYQSMLSTQLVQRFGSLANVVVALQDDLGDDYFAEILIKFGPPSDESTAAVASEMALTGAGPGEFSPYSAISYDPSSNSVAVLKPWTRAAWTIEQAFADAQGISAAILHSGAAA